MSRDPVFAGRAAERELLNEYLRRAISGDQQLVLLEGEAGIGKSSLLLRFARENQRNRKARIFYLSPPGGEIAYQPVHHAALAATSQRLYRRLGGRRQAREVVRSVYLDWLGLIPIIGNLLVATLATVERARRRRRGDFLPSEASVDEDIESLLGAAGKKPLVILLDDLQDADAAEIGRLEKLICVADENARILIVGAYSPPKPGEPHPPVKRLLRTLPDADEFFVQRRLGPLAVADLEELLSSRFPGTAVPAPFLDRLFESTAGHPGAVEEALTDLQFRRGIWKDSGGWHFEAEIAMPILRGGSAPVVDLGAIPEKIAEMVRAASLLGVEFDGSSLARLVALDELEVEDRLAGAVHYGVLESCGEAVLPDGDFASSFRFTAPHIVPLLRETIPPEERASLERRRDVASSN